LARATASVIAWSMPSSDTRRYRSACRSDDAWSYGVESQARY
jgi:hypothetical protein